MASLIQKLRLLQGLLTGEAAFTGPFHVSVDITCRCNLRCVGCRYHSPGAVAPFPDDQVVKDMSWDMFSRICGELRALNTRTLFMLGEGEPLLHDRVWDFISLAEEKGIKVLLITNGTLLDERRIECLFSSGLNELQVSLWACSPENYARQYPGTDWSNFHKVVESLKILSRLKKRRASRRPLVKLHHPIDRFNYRDVSEMADLALSAGCDVISFSPYLTHGQVGEYGLSEDEKEELLRSLRELAKRLESLPITHNIGRTLLRYGAYTESRMKLPCYAGWYHSRIRVDGTVFPCGCCDTALGSLVEKRFGEIWNGEPYRAFRRRAMTAEGLSSLAGSCDCKHCCYAEDTLRVHRVFRPLAPLVLVLRPDKTVGVQGADG